MKKILITTLIVVFLAAATPAAATFTDNGDETVTDDVTGLMWIRNDVSATQGKDAACAYCEDLEFAGYSDWRAPTIEELQTIIDYRYNSPAIDESVFDTTTVGAQYWSSTPLPSIPSFAWGIYTSNGIVDILWSNSYIRCVRGDVLETTFVDNGDGETVTSSDGLVWSVQTSIDSMSWEAANDYCNNLEAGGMSDWFLPTVEELRTLVAFDKVNPAADTSLFEVASGGAYYWTATEQAGSTGNSAWQIKFENGYTAPADKTLAGWIRCAHEAPPENFCECPDCPVCEPEIVEVEKIVEVPAECPACPACEPEIIEVEKIVEVPVEKIVYVESPCSDGDCDLVGLKYSDLKTKRAEISKAIKELKKCRKAATRAMYKARKAEHKALMAKKKAEYLAKLKAKKGKNK
ncbi:MAG: DUF1566 domain-containing protein [Thermodesulfobacteriota bacterium]|nr:DUF1566 domain-containing protein [Thermodesulfobacteriota bacterium]